MKSTKYNETLSTFLDIAVNFSSDKKYFKYKMIPYSSKHEMTKMRQKVSHAPIEETEFELVVGELVLIDMKIFTKANIIVTRKPILPGFSGGIVKLTCKLVHCI